MKKHIYVIARNRQQVMKWAIEQGLASDQFTFIWHPDLLQGLSEFYFVKLDSWYVRADYERMHHVLERAKRLCGAVELEPENAMSVVFGKNIVIENCTFEGSSKFGIEVERGREEKS